jgi:hypothetical protein
VIAPSELDVPTTPALEILRRAGVAERLRVPGTLDEPVG